MQGFDGCWLIFDGERMDRGVVVSIYVYINLEHAD